MSSEQTFGIEEVSTDTGGSTISRMQEQQMMQMAQMEQLIAALAERSKDLTQQMHSVGLALLGDQSIIHERRRAKHKMLQAINRQRGLLDMLEAKYNLTGSLEKSREQMI